MNEQLLLNKWQTLKPDEQEKVLAFIDSISQEKPEEKSEEKSPETPATNYQPKTELGKKLWEMRQKIIANSNIKLLELEDIEAELDESRRRNKYD